MFCTLTSTRRTSAQHFGQYHSKPSSTPAGQRAVEVRLQVGPEGVAALVVEAPRRGEHQRIGVGARIEGHGVQNIILE